MLKEIEMALKISRILHAGYVFECAETQIAFDPIFENPFSKNCHAFPNVKFDHEQIKKIKFDAIFISHFHDDHCSLESLNFFDRSTPIYIYCIFEELFLIIKELGFVNVHKLQIDVSVIVGSFEIIPRKALDADVDSIFQIKASGLNILNVVDSWIDVETLNLLTQLGAWDMILWPFQTMREIEVLAPSRAAVAAKELPIEWIQQLKILKPKFLVPSSCQFIQESWSWFRYAYFPITYQDFKLQIESALPATQVVRLNPGVSVVLENNTLGMSSALTWVQPIGEQEVDYEYKPDQKPMSTAEIACKLPQISAEQTQKVFEFCGRGLIQKYQSLEPPQEAYFNKTRIWRLSVYDHTGSASHFYYNLNAAHIESTSDTKKDLSWSTEIPICKLYEALENGETLTSLYMRINDMVFAPEIEAEIESVDIVEDPLIRCLFSDSFFSYQKLQLKRLLAAVAG